MKAAVYAAPGPPLVLTYVDMPDPVCGPDDVLIAVEAISIEGGDLINRRITPQASPWIVGYAAAGTIVAIGDNVSGRAVGQRVTAFDMHGSHAELWSVPASRTWRVPDGLGMAEAATLPISFTTAHHCLITKGGLRQAETVVVQAAAGGVGLAAVQIAHAEGARVIAIASGRERQARLMEFGASHVIGCLQEDVVDEVLRLTGGSRHRPCRRRYPPLPRKVASSSSAMPEVAAWLSISGKRCRTTRPCTGCSWGRCSRGRTYPELWTHCWRQRATNV